MTNTDRPFLQWDDSNTRIVEELIPTTKTKKTKEVKGPSSYTLLGRWISDGKKYSAIPQEIIEDKRIGPQYLLYYFQASPFILYFSSIFNNYSIYQLDRLEVFKFIKQTVLKCGFKPPFIPRTSIDRSKIAKNLRSKFPYLKYDDINLAVEFLDKSEDKDSIYEFFGLYPSKKEKIKKTKKVKSKQKEQEVKKEEVVNTGYSVEDLLKNFEMEEM